MFIKNCATITTIWFWNIFTTSKRNSVLLEVTPHFPAYTRPTHWVIYFLSLQTTSFWKFHVTGFCSRSEFSSLHFKPFQWAHSSNSLLTLLPHLLFCLTDFPQCYSCFHVPSVSEVSTIDGSLVLILWWPDDFLYSVLSSSAMRFPPQSLSSFRKLASTTDLLKNDLFLTALGLHCYTKAFSRCGSWGCSSSWRAGFSL